MRFLKFMFIVFTLNSCMTYDYSYETKDHTNNIDIYKNPSIKKKYSIGTYISVIGIPLGSGVLLGEHVYNNSINNGSSKDTASNEKYTVIGVSAIIAGIGAYYLYHDTITQKKTIISSRNDIDQWYSNMVDFQNNILLGSYIEEGQTYVLSVNIKDTSKIFVESLIQLKKVKLALTNNPIKDNFLKIIARNSIDYIPIDNYYQVFEELGSIGSLYLEKSISNSKNYIDIQKIKDGIFYSKTTNQMYYLDLLSDRYASLYKFDKLYEVYNWLNIFKNVNTIKIDKRRSEILNLKEKLELEKKKQDDLIAKEREEQRLALEEDRRKKEDEKILFKKNLKKEATDTYNKLMKERNAFIRGLNTLDCVSILKVELVDNDDTFKAFTYLVNTFEIAMQKSLLGEIQELFGINSNVKDGKYYIPINQQYGFGIEIVSCKYTVLKIDSNSDQILLEVINPCESNSKRGEKIYTNKRDLIPCSK